MKDVRKKQRFAPLNPNSLKEDVVELLTEKILSNQIKPGDRLNESELSRQIQVSRAPIREALQQMQQQGLVVNRPRRGMFVVRLETKDIQQIGGLRLIIEAEALRLCRATFDAHGERKLSRILEQMEHMESASWIDTSRLDFKFHRTIWSLTGNQYLEKTLASLVAPLFAHYVLTFVRKDEAPEAPADLHLPLLKFVQGKSNRSAEEVMRDHLKRSLTPSLVLASPDESVAVGNVHRLS